jgi:SAM-dependent methyltransferase
VSDDSLRNRAGWDAYSDEYQRKHGAQLDKARTAWGVWSIPEADLQVLGDVAAKDVLELGCGAAQWSIALAALGARPVGLDNSARQLEHARRLIAEAGLDVPLHHASAEDVPLPDASFDIVFCDHGATSFADPLRVVPEVSRLLRPGGLFAFNTATTLMLMCWDDEKDALGQRLILDYFGMHRLDEDEQIAFALPTGQWIRLFRENGFEVEDLIELRPPEGATTTYDEFAPIEWARRWPAEEIWKVRKA